MQVTLTLSKEQIHKWQQMWTHNGFRDWNDAGSWLWCNYRANAYRDRGGMLFVFETQEEQTAFVLAWLSD